jgi:hypothetical protein
MNARSPRFQRIPFRLRLGSAQNLTRESEGFCRLEWVKDLGHELKSDKLLYRSSLCGDSLTTMLKLSPIRIVLLIPIGGALWLTLSWYTRLGFFHPMWIGALAAFTIDY